MRANANGIEIEYDTFGDSDADPLLLVMGLGAQMTLWDDEFCQLLADRGHYAIRFDNRDVGLSSYFDHVGVPDAATLMMAQLNGEPIDVPYTLDDMAADAAGLLDALSIERAHIMGASMGGMIAQAFAIGHGDRSKSLISIMSAVGGPESEPGKPEVMAKLMMPPAPNREAQIEQSIELMRTIGSPAFPIDDARARERAAANYDRAFHPQGTARQMAAIVAHGSRADGLRQISIPTLVIHGEADSLVPPANGRQTAATVPGAELLMFDGMGHDLPPALWEPIANAVAEHCTRAN